MATLAQPTDVVTAVTAWPAKPHTFTGRSSEDSLSLLNYTMLWTCRTSSCLGTFACTVTSTQSSVSLTLWTYFHHSGFRKCSRDHSSKVIYSDWSHGYVLSALTVLGLIVTKQPSGSIRPLAFSLAHDALPETTLRNVSADWAMRKKRGQGWRYIAQGQSSCLAHRRF